MTCSSKFLVWNTLQVLGITDAIPHSYPGEYSRCAARGHFAVSVTVVTAGVHCRDVAAVIQVHVAAVTTGSTKEPYLNENIKGIPQ